MPATIRILLLADSHLGFDLPARPRVSRRRRGDDFVANYERALEPARSGEVDLVVHGGDVFHRPGPPSDLAHRALEPLARVADLGVPVYVVPGNHERSRLPARFAGHRGVHVFDRPRTFAHEVRGVRVALAGFPYERRGVRSRFPALLARTGWRREPAALRLLCLHHCVEGATVGPGDFTFTTARDVIRAADLPAAFAAVLSGHIHRHQVLTTDLRGRPLAAPVLYPGSIERTSTAEIGEPKGCLVVRARAGDGPQPRVAWSFRRLPARPMLQREVRAEGLGPAELEAAVRALIDAAPADAVLRIRVKGEPTAAQLRALRAERVRALAPSSMNVEIQASPRIPRPPKRRALEPRSPQHTFDLDLA